MVSFIQRLIDRGVAYPAQADVYFDVTKAKDYGKLSHQSLERLEVGARVLQPEKKKNPLDFALWKSAKPDEPCWVSPWGKGRPGWHIECSVMSLDILGEAFDIHGGGVDLIFPHHENEIVQSEGAGMKFASIWVHHGLLTINAQKMSKSLGNFITISDFLNTYKDPDVLKLFFLGTHYAHPIDYNDGKIEEMRKQKARFNNFFDLVNTSTPIEGKAPPALSAQEKAQCDVLAAKFEAAMDNDFNTAQALASLFELIDYASAREGSFAYAKSAVEALFKIFGLNAKPAPLIPKELSALIAQRNKAKQDKDFDTADALRKVAEDTYHFLLSDTGTSVSATER
jgi:cysteinyl-tRNA synthetase